ncbi:hypothetical protein A2U01_0058783, partial [Trifolium medium]|nr:hypothetical protein [Trifolium medium]
PKPLSKQPTPPSPPPKPKTTAQPKNTGAKFNTITTPQHLARTKANNAAYETTTQIRPNQNTETAAPPSSSPPSNDKTQGEEEIPKRKQQPSKQKQHRR